MILHKIKFLLSSPSQRIRIAKLQKYPQLILFLFSVSLIQNHLHLQTSASLSPTFQKLLLLSLEVVPILTIGQLKGMRNHIPLATMQTLVCRTLKREIIEEEKDALSHFCSCPKDQQNCSVQAACFVL